MIIRIGFWGIVYYNYNKEPPKIDIGNYQGPYIIAIIVSSEASLVAALVATLGCALVARGRLNHSEDQSSGQAGVGL